MDEFQIVDGNLNNQDHADALVRLINAYKEDPMGGAESKLSSGQALQLIESLRVHPTSVILFCKWREQLVGTAVCFRGFSTFLVKPLLNIHDLIVLPEYRKRGAGRLLMEACTSKARASGCCKVTLEVRADNVKAQALYRSLGFSAGAHPMEFWTQILD
jgi:ribosomal protein S18 acetylase RimI-like enzyme